MKVRKAGLGKNNEFTKRLNRQTVLDLLRREPAQSRADLARLTRLSPQSLSNIIDDLERAGLIERITMISPSRPVGFPDGRLGRSDAWYQDAGAGAGLAVWGFTGMPGPIF